MLAVLALSLAACGARLGATPVAIAKPTVLATKSAYPMTIDYRITGTAKQADIIYVEYTPTEGRAKHARISLPWTHSFGAQSGEYVYVSGLSADAEGEIRCEITVDGKRLRKDAAVKRPSVASCTATLDAK